MKKIIFILFFFVIYFHTSIFAQVSDTNSKTYDKDGLKFAYPLDWMLAEKSSPETQLLFLSKPKSNVLIVIATPRKFLESAQQFSIFQSDFHIKYKDVILKIFSSEDKKAEIDTQCLDFNGRKIVGTKVTGFNSNNEMGIGELYPFALGNRFLTLAYLRTEAEQQSSDIVWNNLIKSLHLEGSNKNVEGVPFRASMLEKGIINGRALKLVKPTYPYIASEIGVRGEVKVRVLIDKNGDVVSAKAISGDILLQGSAENAAKASKFQPTKLCDGPVEVNGIIVYNFVPKK